MATTTQKVIDWITRHAAESKFMLTQFPVSTEWMPGITDCEARLEIDGVEFRGRGTDAHENTAVMKAVAEAVERAYWLASGHRNTNGFAAHLDLAGASRHAVAELIERDRWLAHFFTHTVFAPITVAPLRERYASAVSRLATLGVEIELFSLRPGLGHAVVTAVASPAAGASASLAFGMIMGSGCHRELSVAAESAWLACLRNTVAHFNGAPISPLPVARFPFEKVSANDHQSLSMDIEYAHWFRSIWLKAAKGGGGQPAAVVANSEVGMATPFRIQPIHHPHPIFADSPWVVVRAENDGLQPLFFGPTRPDRLNKTRLSEFQARPYDDAQIPPYPHPVS